MLIGPSEYRLEGCNHGRIELALNSLGEPKPSNTTWHCVAIRSIGRHRVVCIRDRDDSGQLWDLVSAKLIRIAISVNALVMVSDDRPHVLKRSQPCADRVADNRMLAHDARFLRVELPVLQQHRVGDGDLSAGISAAVAGTNIHACIGIGGAPEGVLTAAAIKCLNGEIQARLVFDSDRLGVDRSKVPPAEDVIDRLKSMGINDPNKVYDTDDLAPGRKIIFAATGVTDGALMRGVRFFGSGKRTHSLVMTTESKHIRFVDTVHVEGGPDTVIRF